MSARLRPGFALVVAAVAAPSIARADATSVAVAETLFRDARELVARGDSKAACPKFAESQRLDPKLGTLLNLATCHETIGMTASAWAEFNEARLIARQQGRSEREQYAEEHLRALEGRLSTITIVSDEAVELDFKLDDKTVGAALVKTALPLDPGPHRLVASRPGRVSQTIAFDVSPGPSQKTIRVPVLAQARIDLGFGEGLPARHEDAAPRESRSWKVPVGLGALGVGLAASGLATYFGLTAASKHDDGNARCDGRLCDQEGLDLQSSARSAATLSTIFAGVGVVSLGVGAFLLLTAPSSRPESPRANLRVTTGVAPGGAALGLGGAF